MERATVAPLSGGRLHLHHGPIDVILKIEGPDAPEACRAVVHRFDTILEELVGELALLRARAPGTARGKTARRMTAATAPFAEFVTPMAAVAGAVADTLIAEATQDRRITRAYANNGGDIAVHLAPGQTLDTAIAGARSAVRLARPCGIATSGWQGRSHSLGIADSVTVIAPSAARADAAATLIANAVDCPDHPGILRTPARDLSPDSDLGARLVTTDVPPLGAADRARALTRGEDRARSYLSQGLITAALLHLQGETRTLGPAFALPEPEPTHA